ncbi:hypothetical protein [Nocardioides jishulii]|uniref:Uncharacterized protein n=1 Tax=Nocardioides jishulii TaxID=2575440 RepID=A0A4U2YRR1_9ACTN|nr:hypothetical protein [Nocardioides jishulii]QCX28990.1 hypothetical protein FCL41_16790 [Nocardioides jishulii]TKI64109.1 hypothetical protein FC770_02775 [Nocardioides jishulii]
MTDRNRDDDRDTVSGDPSVPGADRSDDGVDEEVRGLLADAAGDAPIPSEVAARLDAVLAGLVAERADSAVPTADREDASSPVDLAAERGRRRRRTWWGVAAAAVVLVAAGVALPQLTDDDSTTSADFTAGAVQGEGPEAGTTATDGPTLTRRGLANEVEAYLLDQARAGRYARDESFAGARSPGVSPASPSEALDAPQKLSGGPLECTWQGAGEVREATYEGETVSLVLTEDARGRVVARVVTCRGAESVVLRTITLPSDVPLPEAPRP